jgi:hypothetical protein
MGGLLFNTLYRENDHLAQHEVLGTLRLVFKCKVGY